MRRLSLLLAGFLVITAPGVFGEVPESIAGFFGPKFEQPKLSPDGKLVGVIRTVDGHDFVEVFDLADSSSVNVISMEQGLGVLDFQWADNETIIYIVRSGSNLFGAFPSSALRINVRSKKIDGMYEMAPHPNMGFPAHRLRSHYDYLVPSAFEGRNDVRVTMRSGKRNRGNPALRRGRQGQDVRESFVLRYNVAKERYKELAKVPGEVFTTYSDRKGNVLAAFGYAPAQSTANFRDQVQLVYRESSKDEFQVAKAGHIDEFEAYMVTDGPTKNTAYILEDITGDNLGLAVLDLTNGKIKSVFRPARTDLIGTYLDGNRELYAVRYDDHFPQFQYPNPKNPAAIMHAALSKQFKNKNVEFTNFAADNSKAVVSVSSDAEPGKYYILDLETKKLGALFDTAPEEAKQPLGPRNPIEFKASDGSRLTGYVTLPKGHTEGRLPLIVLTHDERFSEPHRWGYKMQSQIFAANGFAVLEVNQRGVVGFGRKFFDAGVGEFGGLQLDDLKAGVDFAVASGTADADKVCIVGRGWGAHAAFMSAIKHPSLYQCVVTIKGEYDVSETRRNRPQGQFRDRFTERMAGEGATEADIDSLSPDKLAKQIKPALLLVEAKQFSTRLYPQAFEMVRRLREGKADWQIHEESTSRSNNLLNKENEMTAYARVVEFVTEKTR
jgi:dienelactone hydrolase